MNHPINTREELQQYLQTALQVEHATIPPYLTALYSIQDDPQKSNLPSYNIIRAVVVEEMLHLTLAANLLNAIGGSPDLIRPDFVPNYPAYLPTGETDFEVSLERFSPHSLDTFLKIERPTPPPASNAVVQFGAVSYVKHESLAEGRKTGRGMLPHVHTKTGVLHFWSIGEFYKAIGDGFKHLVKVLGEKELFNGKPENQVGPEYYHSSGGEITKVDSLKTALAVIDFISGQGEGMSGRIYDDEGELSHYYRFDQIRQQRHYRDKGDEPDKPTGGAFDVYWDKVYPIRTNLKVADLPLLSEVRDAANGFNEQYKAFLGLIHRAFNGDPALLMPTYYSSMFDIKTEAQRLIHYPLPGGDENAAPTFEMNQTS
jgi:Ferritin-like